MASLDLLDEIARLRALPVLDPPPWVIENRLPKVVAALDVAWGKIKSKVNGKEEEKEEVAVAVVVAFHLGEGCLDSSSSQPPPPLFVEFEPREGFLRGPFPPYEAGKLFNREGPRLLVPLMKRVVGERRRSGEAEGEGKDEDDDDEEKRKKHQPKPFFPKVDLFLVDGFGELHPERFGSACALGVAAGGVPTVGIAKSMLLLGGGASPGSEREARRRKENSGGGEKGGLFDCPSAPGMETWPLGDDGNGRPLAVAMRPAGRSGGGAGGEKEGGGGGEEAEASSSSPSGPGRAAFVSAGHRVPLAAAARAALACYDRGRRFRLPEPSRAADRLARERLREALLSGERS